MMVWQNLKLPLLMKELIEQSAKRRLFVTRILYALLVFLFAAYIIIPPIYAQNKTTISMLGTGKELFSTLLTLQFFGVYLFLPALTCGSISIEKERNTLCLLFLTKLSPWTIILEKVASRWVQMLSLLLTSVPLLAFSYSLGGMETFDLICGMWMLAICVIQVASFSILASAFFRSTTAAFIGSYVLTFLVSCGHVIIDNQFMGGVAHQGWGALGSEYLGWLMGSDGWKLGQITESMFLPLGLVPICTSFSRLSSPGGGYLLLFLCGLPTLSSAAASLFLAHLYLVKRAFLPPTNPLLNWFRFIDRLFVRANRLTRGVMVIKETDSLPGAHPVAWRENAKRSLGQFRYLVRILLVLEIPLVFFILLSTSTQALLSLSWFAVTLIVSMSAANLITGERSRQTLEVLLTSPLGSRQIILEKMSGIRRLIAVGAVPILTCVIVQTWWRAQPGNDTTPVEDVLRESLGYRSQYYIWHEYFIGEVATTFIYLNLVAWLSLWMGIRTASPVRAILAGLGVIVAWSVIPMVVWGFIGQVWIDSPKDLQKLSLPILCLVFSSPAVLLVALESDPLLVLLSPAPYAAVAINSAIYLTCWLLIRQRVLRDADRYLGRIKAGKSDQRPAATSIAIVEAVTP